MNVDLDITFKIAWNHYCNRSCSLKIKDTSHYLLHGYHFYHQWIDFTSSVKYICDSFKSISDNIKKDVLLYGHSVLMKAKINLF